LKFPTADGGYALALVKVTEVGSWPLLLQYRTLNTSPTIKSSSVPAANVRDDGRESVQPITTDRLLFAFSCGLAASDAPASLATIRPHGRRLDLDENTAAVEDRDREPADGDKSDRIDERGKCLVWDDVSNRSIE
jgi:hypothetical protein